MIPLTASMSTRDGVFGRDRTKGATMTDDAVRDCAITRKVSEEFFLEQDRQWIVDIGGERLPPESLEDLRGFERGSEEGRKEAEPFFNLRPDLFAHSREPRLIINLRLIWIQSRFHNLVYTGHRAALCRLWHGDRSNYIISQSVEDNSRPKARLFPYHSHQGLVKLRNSARFRWRSKCECQIGQTTMNLTKWLYRVDATTGWRS